MSFHQQNQWALLIEFQWAFGIGNGNLAAPWPLNRVGRATAMDEERAVGMGSLVSLPPLAAGGPAH
jgi:hypothetical protein